MASPSSEIAPPELEEHISETSSDSLSSRPIYRVFKTRWYILILFSLLACFQCQVWNTWGPIEVAVRYGYGWQDSTVAMMANWGTIMFVTMAFPLSYYLEVRGLREAVILVTALSAIGTVIRTFPLGSTYFTWSSHICAILNGISGVTVMSAPPVISALWFPPNERAFATAVAQVSLKKYVQDQTYNLNNYFFRLAISLDQELPTYLDRIWFRIRVSQLMGHYFYYLLLKWTKE